MKFLLDTANLEEIRQAASFGILDGVMTNPTLAAKEKRPLRHLILEIADIVSNGIVNAEIVSTSLEGMLREAREVASWHPNVVAKIPMTPDGVRALSALSRKGVGVNVTLVFSPSQALVVAKAGAFYVSPFLGRFDDISEDGLGVLRDVQDTGAGGKPASPKARGGSGEDGRAHWHDAVQGVRATLPASAY